MREDTLNVLTARRRWGFSEASQTPLVTILTVSAGNWFALRANLRRNLVDDDSNFCLFKQQTTNNNHFNLLFASTMPPLFSTDAHHSDSDHVVQYQPGFTSSLMNSIIVSKSKMSEWAEMEKAKADAVAETYRQTLLQEQASVDAQAANLLSLQIERGLNVQQNEEETSDSKSESIAARKKALEKEQAMLELEIIKLQTECENRNKRVKGK